MRAPEVNRWTRLVDAHAGRLFAAVAVEPAAVVATPSSFPCVLPPSTEEAAPPFASVLDVTRPEEPDDHAARLEAIVAQCRPGATIAFVACGGEDVAGDRLRPRRFAASVAALSKLGCAVVAAVPFDLLGPCSPWRARLGDRRDRVLAELESHLRFSAVRRLARLVETHVTAALPPALAGRVLVVARTATPATAPPPSRNVHAALAANALGDAVMPLLHDDAVARALAFVDAEWLTPLRIPFDLLGWLDGLAGAPARVNAVGRLLRRQRRWWQPGLESARVREAMAFRLAGRAVAALADDPAAHDGDAALAPTLTYDLAAAMNGTLDALHATRRAS